MTPNSDLTIEQIRNEIASLRRAVENLSASQKANKAVISEFHKEEQAILDEMQKKLNEVRARKQASLDAQASLDVLINSNKLSIDELQALMAKKLQEEEHSRKLSGLANDLECLFAQVEGWHLAADFQKQGVLACVQAYVNGLNGFALFDDMGLGKTAQVFFMLAAISHKFIESEGRAPKILLLTKKNLILSTVKEGNKWVPNLLTIPFFGSESAQNREILFGIISHANAITVANYEVVNTTPLIKKTDWDFVVIDECHKLKGGANQNGPTAIWKNTKEICRKARFTLMLSGTPMVNRPAEMWAYLHIFDPERFPSLRRFEDFFKVFDAVKGDYVISADKLLKEALVGQSIRRRKDEVGIQLPDLTHSYRLLTMGTKQQEVYDMMRQYFFVKLGKDADDGKILSAGAIIAQLTRLRQISVFPAGVEKLTEVEDTDNPEMTKLVKLSLDCDEANKIDEAMELIEELHNSDEQAVVFCTFNAPLFEVQRRCKALNMSCEVVHGGQKRTDLQSKFQDKSLNVLCVNLAMSEGMNLQKNIEAWEGGASHAIMLDLWWTPARNEQAEARIHRIGAHDACTIHILHNEDTVDGFIAMKLEEKSAAFANILERNELRPAKEWMEMLKGLI